jgi:hypothetical protein
LKRPVTIPTALGIYTVQAAAESGDNAKANVTSRDWSRWPAATATEPNKKKHLARSTDFA